MRGWSLLLVLLLVPLALAVTDVKLLDIATHEELVYVRGGGGVPAYLDFKPGSPVSSMQVRYTHSDGKPRTVTAGCGATCRVAVNVLAQSTVKFSFLEGGEWKDETVSLTVDSKAPVVTTRIGECTEACSYSANNNEVIIEITDNYESGVDIDSFQLNAQAQGASNIYTAAQLGCTLEDLYTCRYLITAGNPLTLSIMISDFAGNTQIYTFLFNRDFVPPKIVEGPLLTGFPNNEIFGGKTTTATAIVEDTEEVTVKFQLTGGPELDGECKRKSSQEEDAGLFECYVDFRPDNRRYNPVGVMTVKDWAGNEIQAVIPNIQVFPSGVSDTTDFWNVDARGMGVIETNTWRVHNKLYQIGITLTPKDPGAYPMLATASGCTFGTINIPEDPHIGPFSNNRAIMTIELGRNGNILEGNQPDVDPANGVPDWFEKTNITCDLEITTRVGETVFPGAEREVISVIPRYSYLPTPREQFRLKTDAVQASIESKQKIVDLLHTMNKAALMYCGGAQVMGAIAQAMSMAGFLASPGQPFTLPFMNTMDKSGDALNSAQKGMLEGPMGTLCSLMTCDADLWDELGIGDFNPLEFLPGMEPDSDVSKYVSALGAADKASTLYDPYKSELAALMTGCLPALEFHRRLALNSDCQLQACLDNIASTGRTVSECEADKEYFDCRRRFGNIYNAVPYFNVLGTVQDRIALVLEDPISLILGTVPSAFCSGVFGLTPRLGCKAYDMIDSVTKFISTMDRLRYSMNYVSSFWSGDNSCEAIQSAYSAIDSAYMIPSHFTYCRGFFCRYEFEGKSYFVNGDEVYVAARTSNILTPSQMENLRNQEDRTLEVLSAMEGLVLKRTCTSDEECKNDEDAYRISPTLKEDLTEASKNNINQESNILRTNLPYYTAYEQILVVIDDNEQNIKDTEASIKLEWDKIYKQINENNIEELKRMDKETLLELARHDIVVQGVDFTKLLIFMEDLGDPDNPDSLLGKRVQYRDTLDEVLYEMRIDAIQLEHTTVQGSIRSIMSASFGLTLAHRSIYSFFGDKDLAWSPEWISKAMDFMNIERIATDTFCKVPEDNPSYQTAYRSIAGDVATRISAYKDELIVPDEDGNNWVYAIGVYINFEKPIPPGSKAKIKLCPGSSCTPSNQVLLDEEIDVTAPYERDGSNAIDYRSPHEFGVMCVNFDRSLKQFGVDVGAGININDRTICTEIKEGGL